MEVYGNVYQAPDGSLTFWAELNPVDGLLPEKPDTSCRPLADLVWIEDPMTWMHDLAFQLKFNRHCNILRLNALTGILMGRQYIRASTQSCEDESQAPIDLVLHTLDELPVPLFPYGNGIKMETKAFVPECYNKLRAGILPRKMLSRCFLRTFDLATEKI